MRIIKPRTVRDWIARYPDAKFPLIAWMNLVKKARWQNIQDARRDYPHADAVPVGSDRTATVFNIGGNKYRLIAAIHYNRQVVFVLRFLTHAAYDKQDWKRQL